MKNRIASGEKDPRGSAIFEEPLYICLTPKANRARCGFFLKNGQERIDKRGVYFIQLSPDPDRFETLFTHENAHMVDLYVREHVEHPYEPGRYHHTTPGISDYHTAFIEGWGGHFEILTLDNSKDSALADKSRLDGGKGSRYLTYIQDMANKAQALKRYSWVKGNLLAFSRSERLVDGLKGNELLENFMLNWMNCDFQSNEIRNGQQLLSSEGVCSTFFYRIATDKDLQGRYRDPAFYSPFIGTTAGGDLRKLVPPEENIYLKIILALHQLQLKHRVEKPSECPALLLDFVQEYVRLIPEDKKDVLLHFCETTYFATCWLDAVRVYSEAEESARLSYLDPEGATRALQRLTSRVQEGHIAVQKNPSLLSGALGPTLWIDNDQLNGFEPSLSINLNAAEAFELMTLPGVTIEQARRFLNLRSHRGFFKDFKEIIDSGIFGKDHCAQLERMRQKVLKQLSKSAVR